MNETLSSLTSNINVDGAKTTVISITGWLHSVMLQIATFIAKYISVEPGLIYLALFGLLSLWLGSKIINPRSKRLLWLIISAIIFYLLVWWQ